MQTTKVEGKLIQADFMHIETSPGWLSMASLCGTPVWQACGALHDTMIPSQCKHMLEVQSVGPLYQYSKAT